MNTQPITIDVSKQPGTVQAIRIGQGDKNGTTIEATIYDNGSPLSLSGYSVRFEMRLPDGTSYYQSPNGTVSGNVATIPIDETYAGAVNGVTNIAYIVVYSGSVECSTSRINVIVLESAEEGADAAHAYSSGIIEATDAANDAASSANDAADDANDGAAAANAAASAASSAATAANAAAQEATEAAESISDGYFPLLSAGTSDALLSGDSTLATFARRVSDHDGACRIDSLRGRTVVWNQLVSEPNDATNWRKTVGTTNVTVEVENKALKITVGDVSSGGNSFIISASLGANYISGHKYMLKAHTSSTNILSHWNLLDVWAGGTDILPNTQGVQSIIATATATSANSPYAAITFMPQSAPAQSVGTVIYIYSISCIDLTAMFGAGNEPATVAEFESLFPDAYYPYNAGSLLSVNVEGVKATGKNLIDCAYNNKSSSAYRYEPVQDGLVLKAGVTYTAKPFGKDAVSNANILGVGLSDPVFHWGFYQTASKTIIPSEDIIISKASISIAANTFGGFQLEVGSQATEYVPYKPSITREIPAATYFPTGIKSAGTAYDELTSDKAVTRIGAVDLGSLTWTVNATLQSDVYRMVASLTGAKSASGGNTKGNIVCAKYDTISQDATWRTDAIGIAIGSNDSVLRVYDPNYNGSSDAAVFKTAMSGVMLFYELATPTETPIDPPLNLAYPTEQGGTESIVIPTGEQSAPPTLVTVYAYDADGIVDKSQSIVAPVEGARASANYSVGSYLVHDGTLYRVTTAIATGETINPGTNCVQTTVMAELLALTA